MINLSMFRSLGSHLRCSPIFAVYIPSLELRLLMEDRD
jgi:hypothetical protein